MVTTGVVATAPPTLAAPPKWVQRIDDVVGRDAVSVTIGYEGTALYRHKDWVRRAPASNEKLLLSMALLDQVPPDTTIPTRVLATKAVRADGTLRGDLWIVGHGDPETDRQDLAALAADLRERGVERVRGRVMGSTGPSAVTGSRRDGSPTSRGTTSRCRPRSRITTTADLAVPTSATPSAAPPPS